MPNHITNRVTIFGSEDQIKNILEFIQVEKIEENQQVFGIGTIDFNKITPMPKWVFKKDLRREDEEKYGKENCWLDWSVKNWGTKWNAYSQPDKRNTSGTIYFETAWSSPVDLIKKLSWIFPDVVIEIAWADEDLGNNLGIIKFKDGVILEEIIPANGSIEAKKMYFEITQDSLQAHGMNENFEYVEED